MPRPSVALAALLLALPARVATAQRAPADSVPIAPDIAALLAAPRPALPADADTNDARAYLREGERWWDPCRSYYAYVRAPKGCDQARAVAAFRWAARLDPTPAQPLAFAWAAMPRMRDDSLKRFPKRLRGDIRTRTRAHLDSLMLRALFRNPFLDVQLESGYGGTAEMQRYVTRFPKNVPARLHLASHFYNEQRYDSTVGQLRAALDLLRDRDSARVRPVYESRAAIHYGIGHARLAQHDRLAARDAFRETLTEDLSFYPAHAMLGVLAWENWSDTATAVTEFETAVQLGADDATLRYNYGTVLLAAQRPAEALAQLEAGIALAPEWADLYHNAGLAADRSGRRAEAARYYREFARRAPRRLAERAEAALRRAGQLEQAAGP